MKILLYINKEVHIFDVNDVAVMLILTDADKENIKNMHDDKWQYMCCPEHQDIEAVYGIFDEALKEKKNEEGF